MSNWPGNLIRKTPVTPAGPYQNGAAPGVWSLSEASYWKKQGLWPTAGVLPPFDASNIILPLVTSTYTVLVVKYNWDDNTTTNLANLSNFYQQGCLSVAIDPNKNFYASGNNSTSNTSYNNFIYVPAGSTSVSPYRYYSGVYPEYGDWYGRLCWNPTSQTMQTHMYQFYAESGTYPSYLLTVNPSSVTRGGTVSLTGYDQPDMELLRTFNAVGATTNGTIMFAQAGNTLSPSNNFTFSATSPYTSFSTLTSSLTGNSSRNSVCPVSLTSAVVIGFGSMWLVTSAGATTNISSIGGISSFFAAVPLTGGAFVAIGSSPHTEIYAYSNASTTPTWSTNLASAISNRQVQYLINNGNTLYVISRNSSSSAAFITKIVFNMTDGTYTSTDRSLGRNITFNAAGTYRYY